MEIEVSSPLERPDALARVSVDPHVGVDDAKAARDRRGQPASTASIADQAADIVRSSGTSSSRRTRRWSRSTRWCKLGDGSLEALDGKVTLDENADFRHPDHAALRGHRGRADPLEAAAKEKGLNYVKLDGEVGIIGNGAGLVMSTLDVVAYAGEEHGGVKPANFLDIGGGASAEVMANGLDIILGDPQVQSVFVNVFGGITACDAVANGIVGALERARRRGHQAARRPPRRQQRRRGPADPRTRRTTRWSRWSTPWTARPTRPPSCAAAAPEKDED